MADSLILAIILPGLVAAFLAPYLQKAAPKFSGAILTLFPLAIFTVSCFFLPSIANHEPISYSVNWFPDMGINFDFFLDGLSLTFVLLISGVGTLIVLYAWGYLYGHPKLGNFLCYLLLFMTAMLGLVIADNLILLFIFWELTSISSYLLIGFNHEQERSRYASLQALLTTGSGGLAMMAGFILLSQAGGSFLLTDLSALAGTLQAHPAYNVFLILILLGAFTKSAQFPFYYWLPNAMEAPTPVSAYLHSATMVKAGVYLLARMNPMLGGTMQWQYILMIAGGITMLLGAIIAVRHTDLKKVLAYTTISSLGILVFLIGMGTPFAMMAAMGFLVTHSLYKGTLFMVTGTIDHETGTREISKLGGLYKYMPLLGLAAIFAGLSNAGIPPFFGFIGKELIYEASLRFENDLGGFIPTVTVLTNMLIVATALIAVYKPFAGKYTGTPKQPHEGPFSLWFGPLVLGTIGLVFGVFPQFASTYLVGPAVSSIKGAPTTVKLELWHGLNLALFLSVITLGTGILVYAFRNSYSKVFTYNAFFRKIDPENLYQLALSGMLNFARFQTKIFQSGYLRNYIIWVLVMLAFLVFLALFNFGIEDFIVTLSFEDIYFYEVVLCLVVLLAAFVAITSRSVLAAIAALGIVGYGISLLFIIYGATDLAMTQLSVETLTVILFVLVIYKLPKLSYISSKMLRVRDRAIAILTGLIATFLILFTISKPMEPQVSEYFAANSYILAKGRNIVNVILVDFRALDTMGEIVVLAVASIGVYTLLKLRLSKTGKK
ncbi:putative monovalent cation/H+ antiporter subunit A [Cytophagaceae bacterium ABcell3]|nr:putative monovalent cation/H+ antiporter subunit A [Cytophagaceae bacterium ABcell3]